MDSKHAVRQLRKDFFISVLAVISVGIGLHDMARPRALSTFTTLDILDLLIVAVFIIDFIWSAASCGDWRGYIKKHWYEIPSLIPISGSMAKGAEAVPMLRGLRLVRLVRVLRLLRVAGTAARLKSFWKRSLRVAERAHLDALAVAALLFVLCGAGLAWLFEAPANPQFRSGDAIWWAINMFSNVAYVDFQPVTTAGRFIAGVLEFSGIGFIGLFTASLANAFWADKQEGAPEEQKPLD